MPESAAELEQRAERAVRRGELLAALQLFEELIAREPAEQRVRQRMESVRALIQPAEMQDAPRAEPDDAEPGPTAALLTDAEQGELHASAGRFADAFRCYERAVVAAPDNQLLRERLLELRELAPPGDRADLGSAEQLPVHPPAAPATPRVAPRSHKAADLSFAPLEGGPAPEPLPRDPVKLLETLLVRIRAGRRDASSRA
jgi:tetratricopeptide (TPR) repeat protein